MGQSQSTCSKIDSSFLDFCQIKTGSSCHSRKIWHLASSGASAPSAHFDTLLDDYHLALTPTWGDTDTHSPVHTRPRVDAILHLLLAKAKRKVMGGLGPAEATDNLKRLFWGYEQSITVPGSWSDGSNIKNCVVDYVLWYGDHKELKANLVVLRAEKPIESCAEYLPTLAAIAMIQRNREDGLAKETYGIYTDGFKWIFMHLSSKYKYCSLELNWSESQQDIIGQISKILDKAVSISLSGGHWDATNNCSVWNVKPRDISKEEAESLADYDEPLPEIKTFKDVKTDWLHKVEVRARLESAMKGFFDRYKLSTKAKAMIRELIDIARNRGHNQNSDDEADSDQPRPPPTLAVSDIRAYEVDYVFGLERNHNRKEVWHLDTSEKRVVPKYLSQVLEDYKLAFGWAPQNETSVRTSVTALMFAILAEKKRQGLFQRQQEKIPDNSPGYNSIRWGVEDEISAPWVYKEHRRMLRGTVDNVLWYGDQEKMEGNTVVMIKSSGALGAGLYEAISYMAILKQLRKQAGCPTTAVYGIATDNDDWYFIRICPRDTLSYKWVGYGNEDIVSYLHKFMDHAAGLVPQTSQHESARVSTSQHESTQVGTLDQNVIDEYSCKTGLVNCLHCAGLDLVSLSV